MNVITSSLRPYRRWSREGSRIRKLISRAYSAKKKSKHSPTERALQHFDGFYKGIFKSNWPSIRLALLSMQKNVALINNFGNIRETEETLRLEGAFDLQKFLEYATDDDDDDDGDIKNKGFEKYKSQKIDSLINKQLETEGAKVLSGSGESIQNISSIFQRNKRDDDDDGDESSSDDELHDRRIKHNLPEILSESPVSMHAALNQSEFDTSRLIDPSLGLDSSSLNEYIPATKLKGLEDFISEGQYYSYYKLKTDIAINVEEEHELKFPENLRIFTFGRGDVTPYPEPKKCDTEVYSYYAVDGASLLPVLALGLEAGDQVLDMCSAPGGKAFIILQTMLPKTLVCNDVLLSRIRLVNDLFEQHLFDYNNQSNWNWVLRVTQEDARYIQSSSYNKILVDVPSTEDKLSVLRNEGNIFHPSSVKYRLQLPELQCAILENALKIVKKGGTVVYTTSSLSPVQNDGVIKMALQKVWMEHRMEFTIKDMTPALHKVSPFFRFANNIGMQYGSLVVPFVPLNFGPTYFCKLVKNK